MRRVPRERPDILSIPINTIRQASAGTPAPQVLRNTQVRRATRVSQDIRVRQDTCNHRETRGSNLILPSSSAEPVVSPAPFRSVDRVHVKTATIPAKAESLSIRPMLHEVAYQRLSRPSAILGLAAIAALVLWAAYAVWIKHAELRPTTQLAAAADLTNCIEHYSAANDDKLSRTDLLWSTYYLCDNITGRKLLYEEQVIRNENFVFQRYENTIIMLMVVSITVSGVILAGLQLLASYKLASIGKGSIDERSEVNFSFNSMAVKSSVVGVVILGISFAFFLVFVLYVYTFTPVSGREESATRSIAPPLTAEQKAGATDNVGKAIPAGPSSSPSPLSPPQKSLNAVKP